MTGVEMSVPGLGGRNGGAALEVPLAVVAYARLRRFGLDSRAGVEVPQEKSAAEERSA